MVSPQSNSSSRSSSRCPIRLDDIYLIFYRLLGKLPPLVQTQQKKSLAAGVVFTSRTLLLLISSLPNATWLNIQSPITQSPEKLWGTACLYSSSFDCNSLFIVTREGQIEKSHLKGLIGFPGKSKGAMESHTKMANSHHKKIKPSFSSVSSVSSLTMKQIQRSV
jgi:hypothetical protein